MNTPTKGTRQKKWIIFLQVLAALGFCFIKFGDADCQDCLVTRIVALDDLLVREYVIWSRNVTNQGVCFRLCYVEERCVNFQHNENTGECRALASHFMPPTEVDVVPETGFRLYSPCTAVNRYRAACTSGSDCHVTNTDCIDGTCQCQSGLLLSPESHLCVQPYIGCYEDGPERMLSPGDYSLMNLTLEICQGICKTTGYIYCGTQATHYCYCGDTLLQGGYSKVDDSECNQYCVGNSRQICGGQWRNSVYLSGVY